MTPKEEMKEYVLNLFSDNIEHYQGVLLRYPEDYGSALKEDVKGVINAIQSHRIEFLKMFEADCKCTPDQTPGTTQYHCCNVCGKIKL